MYFLGVSQIHGKISLFSYCWQATIFQNCVNVTIESENVEEIFNFIHSSWKTQLFEMLYVCIYFLIYGVDVDLPFNLAPRQKSSCVDVGRLFPKDEGLYLSSFFFLLKIFLSFKLIYILLLAGYVRIFLIFRPIFHFEMLNGQHILGQVHTQNYLTIN